MSVIAPPNNNARVEIKRHASAQIARKQVLIQGILLSFSGFIEFPERYPKSIRL